MKARCLTTILLVMLGIYCYGQKLPTTDIVAGYGFADAFHVGFKAQVYKKGQLGIYYGNTLNAGDYKYSSFGIDHQYHFGKVSEFSQRGVWFLKQGLNYSFENSSYSDEKYLLLLLSVGREFNISSRVGFSMDIGLLRALYKKETVKDPSKEPWFDLDVNDFAVLPNVRVQFFYSF